MRYFVFIFFNLIFLMFVTACSGGGGSSSTNVEVLTDANTTESDELLDENVTDENNVTFANAVLYSPSFVSEHFSGSQNCASCHDGIVDGSSDVSIVKAWQSTMMANAAIDPLWRAKVASEVKRNPTYKDAIEQECSRCHTPMATVEADFASEPVTLFDDGFLNADNPHYNQAMDGVSCTLCHQIENSPTLGTDEGFSGEFIVADNSSTSRKAYGPYTSPRVGPMQNQVQFTPTYSAHMNESKVCATCHNLQTQVVSASDGQLTANTFTEQAVYTEWEYSDFNTTQSCQDCHMPKSEGSVVISTQGGNLNARSPFFQHKFLGANSYMLNIIKNNRTLLGAYADENSFTKTISDAKAFLLAAADVNITDVSYNLNALNFHVLVNNYSGHKFPTSYPSRRAWLHVKVLNAANEPVFESGALNAQGEIIGVDNNVSADYFQPHHESINSASQVQVYETVMADTNNDVTYTLMNASKYLKDNRILPRGFKYNAPASIQPFGDALSDSNFVSGSDTVAYNISNLPSGVYTISVTLNYQTLSKGFARDLFRDEDLTQVALMKALDKNTNNHYETVSSASSSFLIP
jgi:hypothetical protein